MATRTWVDGAAGGTPINAARLTGIETDLTTALGVPDAALKARIADQTSQTASQLSATYGPLSGVRPGNRLAVLSDSTGRGTYNGDSEVGIAGNTVFVAANSWSTWAQTISAGRIIRSRNASVIGDTVAMMDARVTADVINQASKPNACIIVAGYNDAYANVTPANYMASLRSIVGQLRTAGIIPIIGTPLPTSNNAAIAALLVQYCLSIRAYCGTQGIILLDFQQWGMDPTTGGLTTAIAAGGDGVHPGKPGYKILGQKVADTLSPLLPSTTTSLMVSALDTSNLAPNGKFTGPATGGLAPNTLIFGATQTGTAPSVVTDAQVPGNMQRCTHTGSTAQQEYYQRITGGYAVGDLLEISGIITTAGVEAILVIDFGVPPYYQRVIDIEQDTARGYFQARISVPAGTPSTTDLRFITGPGTGTADLGQLTVRNLTALGIA